MTCAFCRIEPGVYRYDCEPVTILTAPPRSPRAFASAIAEDEWTACEDCRPLIASGYREQLAERMAAAFLYDVAIAGGVVDLEHNDLMRLQRAAKDHADAVISALWATRRTPKPKFVGQLPGRTPITTTKENS
jgi:hypothetical protein